MYTPKELPFKTPCFPVLSRQTVFLAIMKTATFVTRHSFLMAFQNIKQTKTPQHYHVQKTKKPNKRGKRTLQKDNLTSRDL